eukprot:scaffold260041_cov35-Prasinocladus_malaysianus.AAC.1
MVYGVKSAKESSMPSFPSAGSKCEIDASMHHHSTQATHIGNGIAPGRSGQAASSRRITCKLAS